MSKDYATVNVKLPLYHRIKAISFYQNMKIVDVIEQAVMALEKELAKKKAKGGE